MITMESVSIPFCRVDSREDRRYVGIQRRKMTAQGADGFVFAIPMQCCARANYMEMAGLMLICVSGVEAERL